ncbi:hypothetical protein FO519_004912 [Halicephalobus sp. NKZ332]|nr:hypothetical protein FO519_004912 [Halicephalobus sp. NKZ332]
MSGASIDDRNCEEKEDESYQPGFLERWFNFLTCRCDVNEEEFTIAPVNFIELFRFGSRTDKLLVIIGVICGIISGMAYTFTSFIRGKLATVLIEYGPGDSKLLSHGYYYVVLGLVLSVGVFTLTFLQNFLLRKVCTNIIINVRIEFIKALLRQDANWLDKQKFGVLNAELTENIDVIKDGIGEKVGMVVRAFSAFAGCCIFSVLVDWKCLLIVSAVAPICVLLMSFMGRILNETAKKQLPFLEKAAAVLQESLINAKTVQCCNGEKEMVDRYCKTLKDGKKHGVMSFFWNGFFDGTTFFVLYLFYGISF